MEHYMTQPMKSGKNPEIIYYRKQMTLHPHHPESDKFTEDAKKAYAEKFGVEINYVKEGKYKSGQGKPKEDTAEEI